MPSLGKPYIHLRNVLAESDIEYLKSACKLHLLSAGLPCYTLIDRLQSPTVLKIQRTLEERLDEQLYYLNDFYIYTDGSSAADWHVDTELFTVARAVNAWILLSPKAVDDPMCFMDRINDSDDNYYHSVMVEGDRYLFDNCCTGRFFSKSLTATEAARVHTPNIVVGDILAIDPGRFHKTNTAIPKHAIGLKFIMKAANGFLSSQQVDPALWPEVHILSTLIRRCTNWDDVVDGIRTALRKEENRKTLSAGFYPERVDLYRRMAATL